MRDVSTTPFSLSNASVVLRLGLMAPEDGDTGVSTERLYKKYSISYRIYSGLL